MKAVGCLQPNLWQFSTEVHALFYFYSRNWDQIVPPASADLLHDAPTGQWNKTSQFFLPFFDCQTVTDDWSHTDKPGHVINWQPALATSLRHDHTTRLAMYFQWRKAEAWRSGWLWVLRLVTLGYTKNSLCGWTQPCKRERMVSVVNSGNLQMGDCDDWEGQLPGG